MYEYLLCIQMREEARRERNDKPGCPRGSWEDITIVLTHQRMPIEYRSNERDAATQFLHSLRDSTAAYNALGCYMLQIEDLTFEAVKTLDYIETGENLEKMWKDHLAAVGGFQANKSLPILGGTAADLAMKVPNATYADVIPDHLLPPKGVSLLPQPQAIVPPLDTESDDDLPLPAPPRTPSSSRCKPTTSTKRRRIPPAGALPVPRGRTARQGATDLATLLASEDDSAPLQAAREATRTQQSD
jgi:hypothetical protein